MIRIITDTVSSLSKELAEKHSIELVSLYIRYKGEEFKDIGVDLDEFYTEIYDMIDNPPQSSQPSFADFEQAFRPIAEAGDELLGIFCSSSLSGTYEGALRAIDVIKEDYPSFKFRIIDSTSCGYDQSWSILAAADARDMGKSLDECTEACLHSILSSRFLFTPESLKFLQAGGRIGNAAALVGNLIQLSPILTVEDKKAATFEKVRTKKRALKHIEEAIKKDAEAHGGLKNIVVHYIGSAEPAHEWARLVVDEIAGKTVDVVPVSSTIGTHVGPAFGVVYECFEPIQNKFSGDVQELVYSNEG